MILSMLEPRYIYNPDPWSNMCEPGVTETVKDEFSHVIAKKVLDSANVENISRTLVAIRRRNDCVLN